MQTIPLPAGHTSIEKGLLRFWVVPHTHWDREWYLPFEEFQMRLAVTVDEIIDLMEKTSEFRHFTLDGQSVILEDYLELRREREPRLRRLLEEGRIEVGPFYVLPDTYLVGQESLVRNLIIGRQVCERYGGRPMNVWYEPDTFGHVAQTPQLARGAGIDSFIFTRGLGDEGEELGAIFEWQAPDGSRVLAIRQLDGYGNAAGFGRWTHARGPLDDRPSLWPEAAAERVDEIARTFEKQLRIAGLQDVLLCNGTDHQPVQTDLLEMLEACRERLPGTQMHIATYEQYARAVAGHDGDLKVFEGELCSGRDAPVLRGVNSARIYLKQANESAEKALGIAETLSALAALKQSHSPDADARYRYPAEELNLTWRKLLRNHPHDSICGCSVDEVHRAMMPRFESAELNAKRIKREALAALAGKRENYSYKERNAEARSLTNTLPWARRRTVELPVPPSLQGARHLVAKTEDGLAPLQPVNRDGEERAVGVFEVAGFGSKQVKLHKGKASPPAGAARASGKDAIENEFYVVRAASNGTISVTDKRTGETYEGLHYLIDEGDRGDEYNFCPVEGEKPWDSRTAAARVYPEQPGPAVAELRIDIPLRLPGGLVASRKARSHTKVACPVSTVVRLAAGIDRVEFRTTLKNEARDHRLRVIFPAPQSSLRVRAEGHFTVLFRSAVPVSQGEGWTEPPIETQHTSGMIAAGKLALLTRGLPEYQAIPNELEGVDMALTLLRSVGWLSREDLSTRPGGAGPQLATPEAQCLGTHTFEYAISLRGDAPAWELVRASQDYRTNFAVGPEGASASGLLEIEGERFAFGALKGAENGNGVILRLYNPGDGPSEVRLGGSFGEARRCRLDEKVTEEETATTFRLEPHEILTLRISCQ